MERWREEEKEKKEKSRNVGSGMVKHGPRVATRGALKNQEVVLSAKGQLLKKKKKEKITQRTDRLIAETKYVIESPPPITPIQ